MTNQHGFFQNIKSVELEETRRVEPQYVRDEQRRLLRDKERIRERWVRFFHSLLNAKYNMLDPDMQKKLPQQPVASALGRDDCHSDESNGKRESSEAGRPSVGTPKTWTSARLDHPAGSTDFPPSSTARGKSHSNGKTRSLPYSTPRVKRRSAKTTAASHSWHPRVRCSLKILVGNLARTVMPRDCYRRSSVSSEQTTTTDMMFVVHRLQEFGVESKGASLYVLHQSSEGVRHR